MLAHQSTGFRAEFEDGESGRIVDIERCVKQVVDTLVKTVPLVLTQLAVENLRSLDLADIGDKAVNELHVRHFQ